MGWCNDGKWRESWTFEGKRYEVRGNDERDALKKKGKKEAALLRGEISVSGNMTVEKWAYTWAETYKKGTNGVKSYKDILYRISDIIVPAIGSMPLRAVAEIHLQKILTSRRGNSDSDIHKTAIVIRSMFKQAHSGRLIPFNPAGNLHPPKGKKGTNRSITEAERSALLAVADSHKHGLLIKILLHTGVRPEEAAALEWRHVNFNKKLLEVRQAVDFEINEIKETKTEAGTRDIPIKDILIQDLKKAKDALAKDLNSLVDVPFSPVLTQQKSGRRHTKSSLYKLWHNLKKEADIQMGAKIIKIENTNTESRKKFMTAMLSVIAKDLDMYCLRHTFCTDLEAAGVPINVAKYLMGHKDIKVTANIYTHKQDIVIEEARDRINEYQDGSAKKKTRKKLGQT